MKTKDGIGRGSYFGIEVEIVVRLNHSVWFSIKEENPLWTRQT
jgi:hypothetical protein